MARLGCRARSSRRFGKARIAVAVAASLAASPGIDAQQPRPTLRLVASHPYPAVQRPTDIYPEPQSDHFWTLFRDGQKMAVTRDGAAPALWFDAIVPGTLSWDPDSGIPRFFARRAGGEYSVAGTVASPLAAPLATDLVVGPRHVGRAGVPVFTAGSAGAFRLHAGDFVGPVSTVIPRHGADESGTLLLTTFSTAEGTFVRLPDGALRGPFGSVEALKLSPDGTRVSFATMDDGRLSVWIGGTKIGEWGRPLFVKFSSDASNFIATVESGTGLGYATAGRTHGPFEVAGNVVAISPDGSKHAFLQQDDSTVRVGTETGPGPSLKAAGGMIYSPAGALAYHGTTADDRSAVWLGGRLFPISGRLDQASFRFDPTGPLVFSAERSARVDVYIDGRRVRTLPGVSKLYGLLADGRDVALRGSDGALSIGGVRVPIRAHCDAPIPKPPAIAGSTIRFFCKKGNRLNLVEVRA